jgi:hypothetical protein
MAITDWFVVLLFVLQTAVIGPMQQVGFDYADADLTTYQVSRFEASWDDQPFVVVETVAAILADTPPGFTTYTVSPPFWNGVHTVTIRACNSEVCGVASAPFRFRVHHAGSADADPSSRSAAMKHP